MNRKWRTSSLSLEEERTSSSPSASPFSSAKPPAISKNAIWARFRPQFSWEAKNFSTSRARGPCCSGSDETKTSQLLPEAPDGNCPKIRCVIAYRRVSAGSPSMLNERQLGHGKILRRPSCQVDLPWPRECSLGGWTQSPMPLPAG